MDKCPLCVSVPHWSSRETAQRKGGSREEGACQLELSSATQWLCSSGLQSGLQPLPLWGGVSRTTQPVSVITSTAVSGQLPQQPPLPSAHHWGTLSHNRCPGPAVFPQTASSSQLGHVLPVGKTGTWDLRPSRHHICPLPRGMLEVVHG